MAKLSIWNSGKKGEDYKFIDNLIAEAYDIGGTAVYVHLYLGTHDQTVTSTPAPSNITDIEDVLLLENRDRKYSNVVYELRGMYNISDSDFDLKQFGLFLSGDSLFMTFHQNDMVSALGRKMMAGDICEIVHLRDDLLLNGGQATNKFYVVEDVSRASEGYDQGWMPHILRCRLSPMTASAEFSDILTQPQVDSYGIPVLDVNGNPVSLGDAMSTLGVELGINDAIVEEAKLNVPRRYFETQHFYYVPGTTGPNGKANPWIFSGDGNPPDGAALLGSGSVFPDDASEADYYLRTDYSPQTLFQRISGTWTIQEIDHRGSSWSVMTRLFKEFVDNNTTATFSDGTTANEKVNLSKAVRPRADF